MPSDGVVAVVKRDCPTCRPVEPVLAEIPHLLVFSQDDPAFPARAIELTALADETEALHDRGWSDGLPVVAPTQVRVLRMLGGTTRDPADVVAVVPPNLVPV